MDGSKASTPDIGCTESIFERKTMSHKRWFSFNNVDAVRSLIYKQEWSRELFMGYEE